MKLKVTECEFENKVYLHFLSSLGVQLGEPSGASKVLAAVNILIPAWSFHGFNNCPGLSPAEKLMPFALSICQ